MEAQGERLPISIKVGKSLVYGCSLGSHRRGRTPPNSLGYSTSLDSLGCRLASSGNEDCDRRGQGPGAKTNSSYFLDHGIVLHLELCSWARCLELFASGLSFIKHIGFLGMKQNLQYRRLRPEHHIPNDSNLGAFTFC